jgi:hypothetical protein
MGKRAPAPPDPMATAQQQMAVNTDAARVQARLNRGDTVTPFGTVRNRDLGGDRWETMVELSPGQQQIANQGEALDVQSGQLALDMLPMARTALMQPMAVSDADARDRATAGIMSRLEPQFQRDREALEGRLLAQGFVPGSEAYARAADELARARTDARMQAVTAGLGESRASAAFDNAQRAQRVNELALVFGLGPGLMTPQAAQVAQVGVNAPDLMGMVQNNYAQRTAQYGANMGAFGQLLGSAGAIAGRAAFSDRRLKRDVERIGTWHNGLPVYRYRYLWSDAPIIGFMADEVAAVRPEAVHIGADGFARVDYVAAAA